MSKCQRELENARWKVEWLHAPRSWAVKSRLKAIIRKASSSEYIDARLILLKMKLLLHGYHGNHGNHGYHGCHGCQRAHSPNASTHQRVNIQTSQLLKRYVMIMRWQRETASRLCDNQSDWEALRFIVATWLQANWPTELPCKNRLTWKFIFPSL